MRDADRTPSSLCSCSLPLLLILLLNTVVRAALADQAVMAHPASSHSVPPFHRHLPVQHTLVDPACRDSGSSRGRASVAPLVISLAPKCERHRSSAGRATYTFYPSWCQSARLRRSGKAARATFLYPTPPDNCRAKRVYRRSNPMLPTAYLAAVHTPMLGSKCGRPRAR